MSYPNLLTLKVGKVLREILEVFFPCLTMLDVLVTRFLKDAFITWCFFSSLHKIVLISTRTSIVASPI